MEIKMEALFETGDACLPVSGPCERDVIVGHSRKNNLVRPQSRLIPGPFTHVKISFIDQGKARHRLVSWVMRIEPNILDVARTMLCAHILVDDLLSDSVQLVGKMDHMFLILTRAVNCVNVFGAHRKGYLFQNLGVLDVIIAHCDQVGLRNITDFDQCTRDGD